MVDNCSIIEHDKSDSEHNADIIHCNHIDNEWKLYWDQSKVT
jgi:predicted RNA methylase